MADTTNPTPAADASATNDQTGTATQFDKDIQNIIDMVQALPPEVQMQLLQFFDGEYQQIQEAQQQGSQPAAPTETGAGPAGTADERAAQMASLIA